MLTCDEVSLDVADAEGVKLWLVDCVSVAASEDDPLCDGVSVDDGVVNPLEDGVPLDDRVGSAVCDSESDPVSLGVRVGLTVPELEVL